jgi:hypothetical protein
MKVAAAALGWRATQRLPIHSERMFGYPAAVGTWYDPELGRPIAAPLERCAELLGVDLATIRKLAADVEPYLRADGTKVWSLMQLERRMRPQFYRRRRGGYLDRRRTRTTDTEQLDDADGNKDAVP